MHRRGANMDKEKFYQKNAMLDEIISGLRTHRKFKQEFPPENELTI
jgi:hypothetical protein